MSEMNNVDTSFRTKLYNWRMANNLSQKEAAFSLGCTQAMLWKWETGKANPRPSTKKRILPIIESVPAPAQEPEEEPWVPGESEPDEPVYTARPKTFRERMEQRHGGMEEYFQKTVDMAEKESCDGVPTEYIEAPATTKPTPTLFTLALQRHEAKAKEKRTTSKTKLAEVIGFLKCLALYASEGVAEPLEQQIKTLQDIAEEMSA